MTQNEVYFAVKSDMPPQETDALHEITLLPEGFLWMPHPSVHSYRGYTYFLQLECLLDLIKQYGDDILFFGFTGYDTDFKGSYRDSLERAFKEYPDSGDKKT